MSRQTVIVRGESISRLSHQGLTVLSQRLARGTREGVSPAALGFGELPLEINSSNTGSDAQRTEGNAQTSPGMRATNFMLDQGLGGGGGTFRCDSALNQIRCTCLYVGIPLSLDSVIQQIHGTTCGELGRKHGGSLLRVERSLRHRSLSRGD